MRYLLVPVLWGLLGACLAAPSPSFYAPFDGHPQATWGRQSVTPATSQVGPYVTGVRGQARLLGGRNTCTYYLDQGFYPLRGTCSLWVKPTNWSPATTPNFVFFTSFNLANSNHEYVRLILYRVHREDQLTLLVQNTAAGQATTTLKAPITDWRQGQWHQLAFTWDPDKYRLYLDGQPAGEAKAVPLPASGRWQVMVGTPYASWLYVGHETNAIDEFTIWPEVLSATTIRQLYSKVATTLPPPPPIAAPASGSPAGNNLATSRYGAFALASSFQDYTTCYPDNFIDGNDDTFWRPLEKVLPQWLEVRWGIPVRLNQVVLKVAEAGAVGAFSVYAWDAAAGRWRRQAEAKGNGPQAAVTFPEVTTTRLRVVIESGRPQALQVAALEVYGPPQPPADIWAEAPAQKGGANQRLVLEQLTVTPTEARPGTEVKVEAAVRPPAALQHDYAFLLRAGQRAVMPGTDNFSVAEIPLQPDPPTSRWATGHLARLIFRFALPAWAPNGVVPLRLEARSLGGEAALDLVDAAGKPLDICGHVTVTRFTAPVEAPPLPALDFSDGVAALAEPGGTLQPPMFWALAANSYERYDLYGSTGIHLYHISTYPAYYDDTPAALEQAERHLDQRLTNLLRVDPRAQIIVHVELRPSTAWLKRHPAQRLVTAFGSLGPVSYCSAKYIEGTEGFLRALIAFLKTRPYYGRIIGYLPMSCGAPDSCMGGAESNLFQKDRSKLTVGDYNPQAVAAFRQWLREKYHGSVTRLRRAWHDPRADFVSARPIVSRLVAPGADGGVFRDPRTSGLTIDYAQFLSGVMGRFYSQLFATIKQAAGPRVLVGTYYGYTLAHLRGYNTPGSTLQNNNYDLPQRLADPNWDFFAGPTPYEARLPGNGSISYFPAASFRLHHKLLINELDYRTFIAAPTTYGRLHSEVETRAVLRRDLAGTLIDGVGCWFADWSGPRGRDGVGFFTDPSILQTITRTRAIQQQVLRQPKRDGAQIAVFVHGRTMFCQDVYRAAPIYENLIRRTLWGQMSKLGAPYDCYLLEDLADPRVQQGYKLYVFLNPFFLSPAERHLIDQLKHDGKTLLFFYAPGYASPETGLRDENITALTGLKVKHKSGREIMRYTLTGAASPITAGLSTSKTYAVQPYSSQLSRELHPAAFSPVFYIDDPAATVLGRYPDGKAAFAARDMGSWKSVYCAVPYMASEVLRGVCRYAGVHLYCDQDVVLKADNRCLMVHNGHQGQRRLRLSLPTPMTVTDLYTGRQVAGNQQSFEITLADDETRVFGLQSP